MTLPIHDHIADAITEWYGERCPEFHPECVCCLAWKQYDDLLQARNELENLKAMLKGMK